MKARSKLFLGWAAIFGVFFVAAAAFPQGSEPEKFYLGLGVGPIIPKAVTSNLQGTISGTGTLQFNASGFVGLLVGYRFTGHFGMEAEGGWTLYDSHDLVGTFSQSGTPLPGDIPLNGDMHTFLGLFNFAYRPRRQSVRLSPYFGGGIGAAGLEWLVDSRPGGNVIVSLRGGSLSLAADAMAGVDYAISKRFSLGGRYNFVHVVKDIPTVMGGGVTLNHSAQQIHLLQMTGTYRF